MGSGLGWRGRVTGVGGPYNVAACKRPIVFVDTDYDDFYVTSIEVEVEVEAVPNPVPSPSSVWASRER